MGAFPAAAEPPQPPTQGDRTEIWDIALGYSIFAADTAEFVTIACGTDGGPPGRRLSGFADFLQCRPEESGRREVYFEYDDERFYWAKAHRYADIADALGGTRVFGFDAMLSVLLDEKGIVMGWRIVADPRPTGRNDRLAEFGTYALNRFSGGWECTDFPKPPEREAVEDVYIDRACTLSEADRELRVRMEHYRKPGQARLDPELLRPNVGTFALYSMARLEVFRDPDLPPLGPALPPPPPPAPPSPTGDPRTDFLAGASKDCPGCDLSGADLKRRDLAEADLSGANLAGANLHRADLAGARLTGADLSGANLNKAVATQADLAGADLTGAMAFDADLSRADLSGAILDGLMAGEARLTQANLSGTTMHAADFRDAQLVRADLRDADAQLTYFDRANLFQADLRGAEMLPASFWGANLRRTEAAGAAFIGSDFLEADLSEADLAGADLSRARLFRANLFEATTAGWRVSGAILPDGTVAPAE